MPSTSSIAEPSLNLKAVRSLKYATLVPKEYLGDCLDSARGMVKADFICNTMASAAKLRTAIKNVTLYMCNV